MAWASSDILPECPVMTLLNLSRCSWATNDILIAYHDQEWGVPIHDDQRLFEFLILEGAQAGLSWQTILRKRPAFRLAFDQFDAAVIANYGNRKVQQLLANPEIIRNRLKIMGAIRNARAFLEIQQNVGTFHSYIWQFIGGNPRQNQWKHVHDIPCRTIESDAMSKDLKQRGFSFVGTKICYAFMQATGMVNDHLITCFRHAQTGI